MHTAAVQLAPVLAAEKSKVPFYIAGGLLVVWALTISLGLGLRKADFPGSASGQHAIMAVSAVLVIAAMSTAVLTASPPAKKPTVKPVYAPPTAETPGAPPTPAAPPTTGTTTSTSATAPVVGSSTSLALAANPSGLLSYNTKQLSAKAGNVTITMTNMSPLEHNVTVEQAGKVLGATPTFMGGSRSLTLKLKPGTYKFFCSVPGHRQAGMEGTLTVS